MSNVKELADQEAARAEAESPDDPETPDEAPTEGEPESEPQIESEPAEGEPSAPEGETPPPPPPPPTQAQMEKLMDKLGKEDERHAKRYAEILGPDFEAMLECPRCLGAGHVYPPEIAPVPPDQVMAVHISLGEEAKPDFENDENTDTCPRCAGLGQLVTGSKVPGQTEKLCPSCNGSGYVDKETQAAPVVSLPPSPDANGHSTAEPQSTLPPKPEPYFDPGQQKWVLPD